LDILFVLLYLTALTIVVVGPIVAVVMLVVLWRQVGRLRGRIDRLEEQQSEFPVASLAAPPAETTPAAEQGAALDEVVQAEAVETALAGSEVPPMPSRPSIDWELLIGRKALGWVAVMLLLFGTAFFLRYAYENQWIGPVGRVAVGVLAGAGLLFGGWKYHRRDWRVFSQMLSSAGVVVLYLAVFSAFGYYQLVPQRVAGAFMLAVIVESALLAVLYRAPALAWMSLIGGLLTPLLMESESDQYQALFVYLAALSAGTVVLAHWKNWFGMGTVALLGVQGIFWLWHHGNYHPEKLGWAIGFQAAVYGLFIAHSLAAHVFSPRRANYEDLFRLLVNAFLWFTAAFVLLRADGREWMGLLAVGMAAVYILLGRVILLRRPDDDRQLLTALAAAVGFVALAFPIQADAQWVAFGWAAEALALWWFGLRTRSAVLRAMATGLMALAVVRLTTFDTWNRSVDQFHLPVANQYALPALGVAACLLAAVSVSRRFWPRLVVAERIAIGAGAVGGVLLLWLVLSVDVSDFFRARAMNDPGEVVRWRWLGQMTLSALWAGYAMAVLAAGFAKRVPPLRWTALILFAVTIGKVILFDMSGLAEFYRILAFFIVAIVLGIAGRVYQRMQVGNEPAEASADHES
jgi:uncharacterized membrane protein